MKRSLFLPWLRAWSRHSYILHGILIAQMILLPCSSSNGVWVDVDSDGDGIFDTGYDDGTPTPSDPEPLPTDPTDPEPSLPPTGDADGDNLSNSDEAAAGSDPYNPDSDYDGLTDSVETNLTGTDPASTDSNSDGVSDYNDFYGNTSVDEDVVGPGETPYDYDGDGINDPVDPDPLSPTNDPDSDGDYVPDSQDTDPTNPTEWNDANNNGTNDDAEIPNNDSDGDGISNDTDSHPSDPYLSNDWNYNGGNDQNEDWDGDGVSNLQDSHPNTNCQWCDWNGNGVNDDSEAGTSDSDGDGYSDNSDSHSYNSSLWEDWNGNGTNDSQESQNNDGDGYPDGSDSDPYNSSLWEDWNRNGTNDSQESQDSDGDGYADGSDSDPFSNSLWEDWNRNGSNDSQEPPPVTDRDGDGYNDNSDSDPDYNGLWSDWNRNGTNDENETPPQDSDGDGFSDGSDTDPYNSNLWEDNNRNGYNDSNEDQFIDNDQDGRVNAFDTHPNDASLWNDQNSNGQNDEDEITIVDTDSDGYADSLDTHPDDPQRWNDHNNNGSNDELDAPPDSDADGLSDNQDPSPSDSDNDGITNTEEALNGTNPNNSDTDADGSPDGIEQLTGTNPGNVDTDSDGLTDNEEQQAYFTDPLIPNENSFSLDNTPTPSPATDAPPGDSPPETTPPEVVPLDPPQLTTLILDNQVPGVGIEAAYPILENETVSFPSISADPVNKRDLTKTVFLRNDGTSDLIIESVVVTDFNASFTTTPNMTSIVVLMPNEVFSFKVSFNAISAWAKISQSASLVISYTQPGSAAASSSIPGLLYSPPAPLGFVIRLETLVPAGIWQTEGGYFSADLRDTDGDGIPDLVEQMYLPLVVTSEGDLDGDGVNNLTQYRAGRDLLNEANVSDVDKDGLVNQVEEAWAKVYPGMISKYKFEDAYVDPDQDGLLTIEELNCTWGSATVKDPAAVATNPFLKSTGPNNAGGTAALKSALSYKLTSRTVPTSTIDPKLKWSWREASPNYAAWMNDGLLRLAYRASAQNGVYPADFFTRRYSSAAPAALAEVSGFDHLPLGHLRWLKDVALKNVAFWDAGITIPQVTSSIDGSVSSLSPAQAAEIKTKLSAATAKDLGTNNPDDLDTDSMPNTWEARYQLDWRKASDASQPKVKETVAARTSAIVLTTAQKSWLKPERPNISSENAILAALIEKSLDDSSSPHMLPASVAPAHRQTRLINEYPLDAKAPAALSAQPPATATDTIKNAWEAKRIKWRDQFIVFHTQAYLEEIDPDHDGLVNADEYRLGLNPNLADYTATGSLRDTDGDGFSDAIELATGTDSRNATKKPKLVVSIAPLDGPQGRPFETLSSPLIIHSFYRGDKGGTLIAPSATINLTAPDTFTLLAPLAAEQSVTTIVKEAWNPKTLQITTDSNGIGRVGVKLPHLKGSINVTCTASVGTILSVAASCSLTVSPLLSDTDGDGMPDAWEAQIALTTPLNLPAHNLLKTSALDAIESPLHYGYHRDTPPSALPGTPVNIAAELALLRQGGRLITPTSLTTIQGLTAARKTFLEGILKKIDPDKDGLSNLEEYEQRATGLTHPQIGSTPHITIQPKNRYAFSGGQAKLSVAAVTGDGRSPKYFQYQWYQGTANNESNRVSTSTSPDLPVTAPIISGYKSPSYWVKILCDDSTIGDPPNATTIRSVNSTAATVEAMTDIEITREPTLPERSKIDAKHELVVEATGGTSSLKLSFQWYSGNSGDTSNPLPNAAPATFVNGKYISKYTPPKLPPGHHYFWVRVTNTAGLTADLQTAATTYVPAAPVITQQPSSTFGRISAAGTMEVIATSELKLSYQWYSYVPVKGEPPVYNKFTSFSSQSAIFTVPDFNEPRKFYILVQVTDELGNMTESELASYEVISSETVPIIQREPNISYWKLPDDSFNFLVQAVGYIDTIPTSALQYQWYLGERGDTRNPITGANSNTINIPKSDTMPEKIWVDVHNYLRIRVPGLSGRPDTYVNYIQSAKSKTVDSAETVRSGDSPFKPGPPSGNPNPQPNPPFELKLIMANVDAHRDNNVNGNPKATAGYIRTYPGGGKQRDEIIYKGAFATNDEGPPLPGGIQTMINSCSLPFTSFFTNNDISYYTGVTYNDADRGLFWGLAGSNPYVSNAKYSDSWYYQRPQLVATDPNAPTGVFTPIKLTQGTKKTYLIQKTVESTPPQFSIVGSHTFEISAGQAFAEAFPEDKARNMGFFDAVTGGGSTVRYNPLPIELELSPAEGQNDTIVSADTHAIDLSLTTISNPYTIQQAEIQWSITRGSGSLSETTSTATFDEWEVATTLNTSTRAGDAYEVKAKLNSISIGEEEVPQDWKTLSTAHTNVIAKSGTITVGPGEASVMTHTITSRVGPGGDHDMWADGTSTRRVEIQLTDAFGNLVASGVPINWKILSGDGHLEQASATTDGQGRASAVLRSGRIGGFPISLAVRADSLTEEIEFTQTPYTQDTFNLSSGPVGQEGQLYSFNVTAQVSAANGSNIHWQTTRGTLSAATTLQNGTASVKVTVSASDLDQLAVVTASVGRSVSLLSKNLSLAGGGNPAAPAYQFVMNSPGSLSTPVILDFAGGVNPGVSVEVSGIPTTLPAILTTDASGMLRGRINVISSGLNASQLRLVTKI